MGLGTAGAGTVVGSGAFSSATANRQSTVQLAADGKAFLALTPGTGPNGDYATKQDGMLVLDFSDTNSQVDGSGVPGNALFNFENVFTVANQGSQPVGVWIEHDASEVTFHYDGGTIQCHGDTVTRSAGDS